VVSMSSLERPLADDPMILMSSLRCVSFTNGYRLTYTPSSVIRAVPMARLACSCLAMVQGALLMHIWSCASWFSALQCLP
jgi:hypothetical protein